jgi:hypothetical protein
MSGPLDKLVATEKKVDAQIKQLKARHQQAREKFRQEAHVNPSPAEQLSADIENEVERARHYDQENENQRRAREISKDESRRDNLADFGERALSALKAMDPQTVSTQDQSSVSTPTQPLKANLPVGTTATPAKRTKVKLQIPLKFDYKNKIFIDSNKQPSIRIPLRFTEVLQAWFDHDPVTAGELRLQLPYEEIGLLYLRGQVKKKAPPSAPDDAITFRLQKKLTPGQPTSDPKRLATRFASDFRRWLKNSHGLNGDDLFFNDEKAEQYKIVRAGWHRTQPMFNRAEGTKRHVAESNSRED